MLYVDQRVLRAAKSGERPFLSSIAAADRVAAKHILGDDDVRPAGQLCRSVTREMVAGQKAALTTLRSLGLSSRGPELTPADWRRELKRCVTDAVRQSLELALGSLASQGLQSPAWLRADGEPRIRRPRPDHQAQWVRLRDRDELGSFRHEHAPLSEPWADLDRIAFKASRGEATWIPSCEQQVMCPVFFCLVSPFIIPVSAKIKSISA